MAARRIVFLSFVAGSIFVAAAMWMYRDEAKPAGTLTPDRVGDRAISTAARQDHPESTKRALRARSEDLERTSLELAELSTAGSPDDFFEIVIVTPGGTERLFVEGGASARSSWEREGGPTRKRSSIVLESERRGEIMMANFNRTEIGIRLASILLLLATAGLACDEGDDGSRKGLASILIEGASQTARYHVDGHAVEFPYDQSATSPLVISAGRHVIEVHEGEVVALREEIVLEPGETKTLQVKGAPPE